MYSESPAAESIDNQFADLMSWIIDVIVKACKKIELDEDNVSSIVKQIITAANLNL